MTTTLPHPTPVPPSPEPRISGVNDEDLAKFLAAGDDIFDGANLADLPSGNHPSGTLVSPSPEPRISGVDDEDLAKFLASDDVFDGKNLEGLSANELNHPSDNGLIEEENICDDIFPKEGLQAIKSLPELESIPTDGPVKSAQQTISEALQAMPVKEREQVVRDIYGIEQTPFANVMTSHVVNAPTSPGEKESPEFLETKLQELEKELVRLKGVNSWNLGLAALEMAEASDLAFTQNRRFRLKFLRCERFNVHKAATRFIRHFDWKLELFGEDALAREITLKDLTKEDQEIIKKGYLQRLPVRDRAGRSIAFGIFDGQTYESPESMARVFFYMNSDTDEESDARGHVMVTFKLNEYAFKKSTKAFGGCFYIRRIMTDFPTRWDAFHKFLEKEQDLMHRLVDYAVGLMSPGLVCRVRVHYGKHSEWMNTLLSFGIPQDVIPFTQSYKIKLKNHMEYLAMRAKKEAILASNPPTVTPDKLIDLPSRKDVLLGKGKPIQFSSGNQHLSTIIDGYLDQYHEHSSKAEKTALAQEIVRMVKANGVRFLSKEMGIWMEVPDDMAREKVSHMFRHQRQRCGPKKATASLVRSAPVDSVPSLNAEVPEQAKRAKV